MFNEKDNATHYLHTDMKSGVGSLALGRTGAKAQVHRGYPGSGGAPTGTGPEPQLQQLLR